MNLLFLWRENYHDYLWASTVTAPVYFLHSGVLLYENGVLSAYATPREYKEAREVMSSFVHNPEKLLQSEGNFEQLKKEIRKMKVAYTARNIRGMKNEELYRSFLDLISFLRRYVVLYRLTEPHFVASIEQKALETITSQFPRQKSPEKLLVQFLSPSDRSFRERYRIGKEGIKFFSVLRSIAKMRFQAKKISSPAAGIAEDLLRETARRTYFAVSQVSSMNIRELEKVLVLGEKPDLEDVNKRRIHFALRIAMCGGRKVQRMSESRMYKIIAIEKNQLRKKILKGTTAYPGKVKGTVKVVPLLDGGREYRRYIDSLRKKHILVAPMINPDLTPAFSRVAAVVTDEGGLLSHAALVAREKRVPCIVGTRLATRVLKEREQVTVDASHGTVTRHDV